MNGTSRTWTWIGAPPLGLVMAAAVACGALAGPPDEEGAGAASQTGQEIRLPKAATDGKMSLERALVARRSLREFSSVALTLSEIGQLAWAGQGIRDAAAGWRTAPSAGALYPMELYYLTVEGLFHYQPRSHTAIKRGASDLRAELAAASLGQASVTQAPCVFVLTAVPASTERRYRARTPRYIAMEAGHVGQNILLQAVALGLGGVPIGAFTDEKVAKLLGLGAGEEPLYILAVGRPLAR
jgi:SagB-type dehydrogenase family enzyme